MNKPCTNGLCSKTHDFEQRHLTPDVIPARQPSIDNIEAESDHNLRQTILIGAGTTESRFLESQSDDLLNEVIEPYAARQAGSTNFSGVGPVSCC